VGVLFDIPRLINRLYTRSVVAFGPHRGKINIKHSWFIKE
jgi:hypothetical protein